MGTGSFGGGSGSYGAGGSGSTRSGARGGRNSTSGIKGAAGSVLRLVSELLQLSREVNKDPSLPGALKSLSELLQDRGRSEHVILALRTPLVQGVFEDLLALARSSAKGVDWDRVARRYSLNPASASLSALARAMLRAHQDRATDERHLESLRLVVADIFIKAVGNDLTAYYGTLLSSLGATFHTELLQSVSVHYLSGLLRHLVRRDLMKLSTQKQASMEVASYQIANAWYAEFEKRKLKREALLGAIAQDYATFAKLHLAEPQKVTK